MPVKNKNYETQNQNSSTSSNLYPFNASSAACQGGVPVYDNTNFISFVKSLLESGKQTSQLLKTVKFLEQQKENIDKVNDVIKQLKAVQELANNNQRLFDIVQSDLREIFNSPPYIKPEEVNRVSDSFESIIENSIDDVEYIDKILSSGLKMTDSERVEVLRAKELESKEMVAEIEAKTRRYREIIAFREIQAVINGREAKF